jgi:uridine kinase
MQIQDMVKLIYQNEFAGGHLIEDEEDSLRKLQDEWSFIDQTTPDREMFDCAFENIGNDLCRFHLMALKYNDIGIKTVNRFFVSTSNSIRGNIQNFEKKLDVLRQCCNERQLPYSLEELEAYLYSYKRKGYPPVSHSDIYRAAYSPAYRIVKSEYCDFFEVFCRIDSLLKLKKRVNIAIDGNSGAGKTTLAQLVGDVYECNIFHMDDFFLTPELRTEERLKEIGGNVDYVRFKDEVINGVNSGRVFQYRIYDCKEMTFGKPVSVTPKKLNIIEGSYSMHPTLVDNYDLKIFLHIDEKKQISRILRRNGKPMLKRFLDEWIPMENKYFEGFNIREQSDLVFVR